MKNIGIEKLLGGAAAIATIIGVCITLVALIPSFGAWLFPREIKISQTPTNASVIQQPQATENLQSETPTQAVLNATPDSPTPIMNEQVLSDLPGTPLESGMKITSILDKDTKPRDVYSLDLKAGQTVYLNVENPNAGEFYYIKPGFSILDKGNRVFILGPTFVPTTPSFVAATTGTYYLIVLAYVNGGKYELTIFIE